MTDQQELPVTIGTGCIFYFYNQQGILSFLLQKRAQQVVKYPGLISTLGGYSEHTTPDGELQHAAHAIWREMGEEAGQKFLSVLSQDDFTIDEVVKIRPNIEISRHGEKRANYHLLWAKEISEADARLADCTLDPDVDTIMLLTASEVYKKSRYGEMVPWFRKTLSGLQKRGIIPYPHI
jgi:hypothetical protein